MNSSSAELLELISIMRATWDHHKDQIFVKDLDFRYIYINNTYLSDTGLTQEEVLGKNGFQIFENVSDDLLDPSNNEFHQADKQVIETGNMVEYESVFSLKDTSYYSLTQKSPLYGKDNEIIGILGRSRNIGDQIETRLRLKENLTLLETLMDTVPYPIFIKDLHHRYIKVNKAFVDEIDLPVSDLINRSDADIFGGQYSLFYEEKDDHVVKTGERVIYVTNNIEGNRKNITIKEPLRNADEEIIGIVGIINPFTNISEITDEILNQQKIESISTLAAGIAHDLNNVLTSIMGISSMMMNNMDENIAKMNRIIYKASITASNLIQKLLTFSKQTAGNKQVLSLSNELKDVLALLGDSPSKSISIHRDISEEDILIYADKTQMSQLFLNLLLNAIEAIDERGTISVFLKKIHLNSIGIEPFITQPEVFTPGIYAWIRVEDTGKGMSDTLLSKVFEPFYTTKEHGGGLGLSVVYGIISGLNGMLKVTSELDKGTIFDIYLPVPSLSEAPSD